MAKNRGKDFENIFYNQMIQQNDSISIDRFYDTMGGFINIKTVCDFVCYQYPFQFYFELKAIKGNTLNFKSHITEFQWQELFEKSKINGVFAGVIVWFIDNDITAFIPIEHLHDLQSKTLKSFNVKMFDFEHGIETKNIIILKGKKKRIYFNYDMKEFMERMIYNGNN